jgi:predicted RNase H-like nuclease (RuvC/YqgF family)
MKLLWVVVIILALVIVWLLLRNGEKPVEVDQVEKEKYEAVQKAKEEERAKAADKVDSVAQAMQDSLQGVWNVVNKQKKEINRLERRVAVLRPQIQPYIDSLPVLKSYVQAQDSLMQVKDSTINTLTAAVYDLGKSANVLEGELYNERIIAQQMLQGCEARNAALEDQIEESQKKNRRFWPTLKRVGKKIVEHGISFGAGYVAGKVF